MVNIVNKLMFEYIDIKFFFGIIKYEFDQNNN